MSANPPPPVPRTPFGRTPWPAVVTDRQAQLLQLQQQFAQSQWWPNEVLKQHQLMQAAKVVAHAYETVPFYRPRLEAAGYRPGQALDWEFWRRIPPVTRTELRLAGKAVHSTSVPQIHGQIVAAYTSGSTASPLEIRKSELEQVYWNATALREDLWHRRRWDLKIAIIRGFDSRDAEYPDGKRNDDWGPPLSLVYDTGPAVLLEIRTDVGLQAEWLKRQDPDYFLTFGSNIFFLAQEFRARGWTLPRLRAVRSIGEIVDPEIRRICREVWGAPLTDVYSCEEVGYLGVQCPEHEHYHAQMETSIVEILDDRGEPCAPGEVGRVVVSSLHNFVMPLLRYELGDYAEAGAPCPCGRGLDVLSRRVGRARDFVLLPNGDRRFAWQSPHVLVEIEPVVQYQIAQVSREEMEVRMVATRPLTAAEEAKFAASFIANWGYPFRFRFAYRDSIPRVGRGKYFVFRSELPPSEGTG